MPILHVYALVDTTPLPGVPFTLDGIEHVTPFAMDVPLGQHTVAMLSNVQIEGNSYSFISWTDGSTDPTKTGTISAESWLTATYQLVEVAKHPLHVHALVDTKELIGVPFTLDGAAQMTPFAEYVEEGTHTIVMPSTVEVESVTYKFVMWENGSTDPARTGPVVADSWATATYEEVPPPPPPKHTVTVGSIPVLVPVTVDGVQVGVSPVSVSLEEGDHEFRVEEEVEV